MNQRGSLIITSLACLTCACGPTIKTITPTGKKPLDSVLIEGTESDGCLKSRDHACIIVDGGIVGTPMFSYPKPEVFVPVRRADGHTTTGKVEISARNADGSGNTVEYAAATVPVNAPPVSIDVTRVRPRFRPSRSAVGRMWRRPK